LYCILPGVSNEPLRRETIEIMRGVCSEIDKMFYSLNNFEKYYLK
jgi:hypothetical protein